MIREPFTCTTFKEKEDPQTNVRTWVEMLGFKPSPRRWGKWFNWSACRCNQPHWSMVSVPTITKTIMKATVVLCRRKERVKSSLELTPGPWLSQKKKTRIHTKVWLWPVYKNQIVSKSILILYSDGEMFLSGLVRESLLWCLVSPSWHWRKLWCHNQDVLWEWRVFQDKIYPELTSQVERWHVLGICFIRSLLFV